MTLAERTEALGPALRGMLWMTLCGLCFAVMNATSRVLTADLHAWQIQCLRYFFGGMVRVNSMAFSSQASRSASLAATSGGKTT